jgi:hypothetical protein
VGYGIELYATDIDTVIAELTTPTLNPDEIDDDTGLIDDLHDNWTSLADTIAAAIADGGGEAGGDLALYVQAVVRASGHFYGSLAHTSSGGDEFRSEYLPGPVAARFGRNTIVRLINRELAGITWADYPLIGYLTPNELADAITHADTNSDDIDADLNTLDAAFRRAHRFNLAIISIYG